MNTLIMIWMLLFASFMTYSIWFGLMERLSLSIGGYVFGAVVGTLFFVKFSLLGFLLTGAFGWIDITETKFNHCLLSTTFHIAVIFNTALAIILFKYRSFKYGSA